MTATVVHEHVPIFRVVRRGWPDAADTRFSQFSHVNNRWNTPRFPALYCCCSETVARAIVRDIFRFAGVDLADLQETAQPQLVEIHWSGEPIDMVSEAAIAAAGFSRDYPMGSRHSETQRIATKWHEDGAAGVLCRSASLARVGYNDWTGDHALWSELAIYTDNSTIGPSVLKRRDDLSWLIPVREQTP
jgi:hypothetical protein